MPYLILKLLINFKYVKRTEQTHGLELRYIRTFYYLLLLLSTFFYRGHFTI